MAQQIIGRQTIAGGQTIDSGHRISRIQTIKGFDPRAGESQAAAGLRVRDGKREVARANGQQPAENG